ncbi:cytochrome b [Candidatus Methylospira mobilis]|uniref:cytochrome b n=1 Tax=Candidatus Methylospira mobilis TaxID=1808979 RepID=UPI0028E5C2EE|nr:cytochrome b [Candidatus Methylospira mobilis]WNV03388.1 cytochrome b [Candidatus Methylospira mobilis]
MIKIYDSFGVYVDKQQLNLTTRSLHWLVALSMIFLTVVGFYMSTFEVFDLYDIHKAVGVAALIIIIPRIILRVKKGWLAPVRDYPLWEHKLAVFVHWALLLSTIIMPVSGLLYSSASGHGVEILGFVLVPSNYSEVNPSEAIPFNSTLSGIGEETHGLFGYVLATTIVLHVVGTFKHHYFDKDRTLLRMLGK